MKMIVMLFWLLIFSSCAIMPSSKNGFENKSSSIIKNQSKEIEQEKSETNSDWRIEKLVQEHLYDTGKVYFKNGKSLDTQVYKVEIIDLIQSKREAPYVIFSGRVCAECDANTSIFIQNPLDQKVDRGRYSYPGKETNYDNELVSHFKTFYGSCFNPNEPVAIWIDLQNNHNTAVYLNKSSPRIESISKRTSDLLNTIKRFVARGSCKEIPAKNGRAEL